MKLPTYATLVLLFALCWPGHALKNWEIFEKRDLENLKIGYQVRVFLRQIAKNQLDF